ncbi:hypothetical protein [Mycobacterium marinum]|uniref:hypothetical protein n=1 Tax=Mycobacterium marinum TaxID=1781 RepID=UPI0035686C7C
MALELAEFLGSRGRLVSIVEFGKDIAPEVGSKRKTEHMDHLDQAGSLSTSELSSSGSHLPRWCSPPRAEPRDHCRPTASSWPEP